jgi:hypothetical protein
VSNKLSQLPNYTTPVTTDAVVGIQSPGGSPLDVQIPIIDLLGTFVGGTILSSKLTTASNTGGGGGTINYINLGGIKFLWGISAVDTSGTGGSFVDFTFPVAFFSTVQAILASPLTPTGTGSIYCEVDTYSTSGGNIKTTSASAQSAAVSIFVIGS